MTEETAKRGRGRPRAEGADEEIRAAALRMLREKGYRELTMDGVAERAGVAKTSVYRRWPTKGALVAAALAGKKTAEPRDLRTVLHETCEQLNLVRDADDLEILRAILEPQRERVRQLVKTDPDLLLGPLVARFLLRESLDDAFVRRIIAAVNR